ncbi:MAG: ferritin-like domain-containing protein [candidate division WOR-3 bacterium]|nr:ferritin-like domain-containing protein [candidate division WOR-3 bacterium]MCX7947068.1 ferritin-like domain-containing protein [candidate division WOR-3 bacterium]MDW8149891.1 ferritin-like domain-containing protein [candidate division WOR-3 bacterium]
MKELIDALNEDLAFEYSAIIQYITYSALIKGINRVELKEFFLNEINDELEHAKYLSDKISALGGTPSVVPKSFKITEDPREMIEELLNAEEKTIERYANHAKLAEKLGHIDIKVQLENIIVDEARHRDELKKILEKLGV